MGEYAKEKWYRDRASQMVAKYGDFPPPWVYADNSHPYSIGWRMGDGESHLTAFDEWWVQQDKSFDDRIAYFRKWPAPPRWCGWMADAIWDLEPWESEGDFDYTEYFSKLKKLGFEGTDEYEADLSKEEYD
ncbi:hypothetical protein [Rhodopirellula europaea]|uniref:Uncharacterized protein n=1 Tax=Rhodopirellula europaea 6C TaxID=1263867 RepID=M2A3B9_9BACT|nr:hypothetical protein [Rhodopirellula europaea]EMB13466.1 hypothetical protein RE6C_05824 [Rhodopirellula europaea 6C]